jgi:ferric-dicitrate binding protein FerR (iron transport regulator)
LAVAAGLAIVATTTLVVTSLYKRAPEHQATELTYQTGHNEQSRRLLPEGTVASMGADSILRVRYTATARIVDVLGGEVDLDVVEDIRPFTASTFLADIEQGKKFRVLVEPRSTRYCHAESAAFGAVGKVASGAKG